MQRDSVGLRQVLLARGQRGGIGNAGSAMAISLMVIGFMILVAYILLFYGILIIVAGVVLLVVKVFGFLLRAPTYGTASSGENTAMRYHSDIRGDV